MGYKVIHKRKPEYEFNLEKFDYNISNGFLLVFRRIDKELAFKGSLDEYYYIHDKKLEPKKIKIFSKFF